MTTATRSQAPITRPQSVYLERLVDELSEFAPDSQALPIIRRRVGGMTKSDASAMVDQLKVLLREARAAQRERTYQTPELEPGYYEHDGVAYEVVRSQYGRLYAERLDLDRGRFVYDKGAIYKLAGSRPLTLMEAAAFGKRTKRCIVCGHRLKTLESQQFGIGPVCRKRFA